MARLEPFTVGHFEKWAGTLRTEDGVLWQLEPFQLGFIEDVFAGHERFRECWLVVPEGNGKTTLLAGLGLYALLHAEEAQIPIAASSMNQAKILYRQAKGFIRRCNLSEAGKDGRWLEAYDGWRRIDIRKPGPTKRGTTMGVLEVYGSEDDGGDGVIPYPYAFIDELHRQKLDLYETWRGKLDKRRAQIITISTAGAPGSDFEETRDRIRAMGDKTRKGRTFIRAASETVVMHEWAVPPGGNTDDLELVAEANPFSGVTPAQLADKKATPTMTEAHWKRFSCNIPAVTDMEVFIDHHDWTRLAAEDFDIPAGAQVCIGADGSRSHDTTVIAWATALDDVIDVDCRVFTVRTEAPGHVFHHGGTIDYDDVETFLIDLFDRFEPLQTAYDPRYLERSMEIVDARLPSAAVIAVEPNTKHARDAYQALFTAVIDGRIRHRGDPVVAAHLANCAVDRDDRNNEIRRLRKADKRRPIDAVPAIALAVWRATLAQESVYQDRDMVMV